MDQTIWWRSRRSTSFLAQNPESARIVTGPAAPARFQDADEFINETDGPAGSVRGAVTHPGEQDLAGALFGFTMHLADRGVQIDHDRCVTGPAPAVQARCNALEHTASSWRT